MGPSAAKRTKRCAAALPLGRADDRRCCGGGSGGCGGCGGSDKGTRSRCLAVPACPLLHRLFCWLTCPCFFLLPAPPADPQISTALAEVVQRHLGVPSSRFYIKVGAAGGGGGRGAGGGGGGGGGAGGRAAHARLPRLLHLHQGGCCCPAHAASVRAAPTGLPPPERALPSAADPPSVSASPDAPTHPPACPPAHIPNHPPTFPPTRLPNLPPAHAPTHPPAHPLTHSPINQPSILPPTPLTHPPTHLLQFYDVSRSDFGWSGTTF